MNNKNLKYGNTIKKKMGGLDKILKDNKGFSKKALAIVLGTLILGGVTGYSLYNQKNNNPTSNQIPQYKQVSKTEDQTKNIDLILNEFSSKGYQIEHFPHGEIKKILDDGRILFEDKGLKVYNNGKITNSTHVNDVKKTAAIMNGEPFLDGNEIQRIKANRELDYYIGDKAVKTSLGDIWTYDGAGKIAFNEDKSLMAFSYSKPFGTPHFLTGINRYLAIQKINENEIIKFKILDILKEEESRKEAAIKLAELNEEFEKTAVTKVMGTLVPNINGASPTEMYELLFDGKTKIIDKMFNVNISSTDENKELNTLEYTFDKIYLEDENDKKYPNGGKYPTFYKMCWMGDDLYMRAKLKDGVKESSIFKINFPNKNFTGRRTAEKIIDGNSDNPDTKFSFLSCFPEGNKLYLLTRDEKLKYYNINTNKLEKISDTIIDNLGYGDGKLYLKDKQGNNFILDLK